MDAEETGPAPDAAGNGPDAEDSRPDVTDGEAGKQLALRLFREHRKEKLADALGLEIVIRRRRRKGR